MLQDESGETALHWAAAGAYSTLVELLAAAGADLCLQNHFGDTAVARAASEGNAGVQ